MHSSEDTIAAIATPLGEGGIGVIRVSGAQAIKIVQQIFHTSTDQDLSLAASHTCHVGTVFASPQPSAIGRGRAQAPGEAEPVDQVVVTLFRAPHSYTGEEVVEISAHGNPFTLRKILSLCLQKGARVSGPGEFTERAFVNGKMDLTQAEAVAELIRAKTDKSQAAALAQMQGRLSQKVRALRDTLLPLLAHVEVGLDHSDEDHDFLSRENLVESCRQVQRDIDTLLASARTSKILRDGYRVSFLGRPNVGKSSLLNALLKEDRAIVTPIPGTTRDTLEEGLNLDGVPVILTDTAGLRAHTTDPVERLGVERTRKSLEDADVVIGLFDGSEALTSEDEEVIRQAMAKPHIWVINKSDLPQRLDSSAMHRLNGGATIVPLSAKTGEGLETLAKTIAAFALMEKAHASEAQWLLNTRHQAALEQAHGALVRAAQGADTKAYEECVALELKTALDSLGEIIGETTTEELLDQIFSTFCIGK